MQHLVDKRLAKYECMKCQQVFESVGTPAFNHDGKYMGPCRWNVECNSCGSMYAKWLNYGEFRL